MSNYYSMEWKNIFCRYRKLNADSRRQDDDIDFDREKEDVAGIQFARMTRMIDRHVIWSYMCEHVSAGPSLGNV